MGSSHAAAVDSSGHLYTWGTGNCGQLGTPLFTENNHLPSVVESARIFTVKRVVCGDTYTCICTGGGYVYMYGVVCSHQARGTSRNAPLMKRLAFNQASSPRSLASPRREGAKNHPYTLPELEQHFISQVAAGDSFVAVLTDGGQVYVFDDCMELIKLPLSTHATIKTIAAGDQCVYGILSNLYIEDENILYEWRDSFNSNVGKLLGTLVNAGKTSCPLLTWPAKIHALDEMYSQNLSLTGNTKAFVIMYDGNCRDSPAVLGKCVSQINPYKRSQYTMRLIDSIYDSLDYGLSPIHSSPIGSVAGLRSTLNVSPVLGQRSSSPLIDDYKSIDEFEKLLNIGEDDKAFEKMVQCRLEFEQRDHLMKAFVPILSPLMEYSFRKMKEYSDAVGLYRQSLKYSNIISIIDRVLTRNKAGSLSSAMNALVTHKNMVEMTIQSRICEENYVRQLRDEGLKNIMRILHHNFGLKYKKEGLKFFSILRELYFQHTYKRSKLSSLTNVMLKCGLKKCKYVLNHWSNYVIRLHISGEGLGRLFKTMLTNLTSAGLFKLASYSEQISKQRESMKRILRRITSRDSGSVLRKAVMQWKTYTISKRYEVKERFNFKLLAAKTFGNRLSLKLKRVLKPCFKEIYNYVHCHDVARMKYPIMFLTSLINSNVKKSQAYAFHKIARMKVISRKQTQLPLTMSSLYEKKLRGYWQMICNYHRSETHTSYSRKSIEISRSFYDQNLDEEVNISIISGSPTHELEGRSKNKSRSAFPTSPEIIASLIESLKNRSIQSKADIATTHLEYLQPENSTLFLQSEDNEVRANPAELDSRRGTPSKLNKHSASQPELVPKLKLSHISISKPKSREPTPSTEISTTQRKPPILKSSYNLKTQRENPPSLTMTSREDSAMLTTSRATPKLRLQIDVSDKRPPWKAPSRSASIGKAKLGTPQSRRIEYSQHLKLRLQEIRGKKQPESNLLSPNLSPLANTSRTKETILSKYAKSLRATQDKPKMLDIKINKKLQTITSLSRRGFYEQKTSQIDSTLKRTSRGSNLLYRLFERIQFERLLFSFYHMRDFILDISSIHSRSREAEGQDVSKLNYQQIKHIDNEFLKDQLLEANWHYKLYSVGMARLGKILERLIASQVAYSFIKLSKSIE